jgi:hypothetical protein
MTYTTRTEIWAIPQCFESSLHGDDFVRHFSSVSVVVHVILWDNYHWLVNACYLRRRKLLHIYS